jgi:hypothetical protein
MPSPTDSATLQAIFEGVEHARSEAEAAWGAERLPLLVERRHARQVPAPAGPLVDGLSGRLVGARC